MKNWMYKCIVCDSVSCVKEDHGEIWYRDCGSCRSLVFHHKVTVHIIGLRDERAELICEMDKEEEDEHSNTRTDQEK